MHFNWMDDVKTFFADNELVGVIFDAYFSLIIISIITILCFKFKKALLLTIVGIIMLIIYWFADLVDLTLSKGIYQIALASYIVVCTVILAPELRKFTEPRSANSNNNVNYTYSNQDSINSIVDAVFSMSSQKVGALITIEQHMSLNQYAERAITLNSDITRELLEQIFIKDSPLHDGGVIIRGNKIVCAAAYYTLTQQTTLDKTTGSRHRAGVGISEITDSLTIIVSEETGRIDVATQGYMKPMTSKSDLTDFIATYLGESGGSTR